MSIELVDLRKARNKVVEYYNKFYEMDPSHKTLRNYLDLYNFADKKMFELVQEFNTLINTSNLSLEVGRGGRKPKSFY
jgi:hypothetical protein